LDQDYVEVKAYLGLALDQLGDEQGMTYLREAVQEAPRAALPKVFMALHWLEEGAFQKAKEELEKAATLDPENPAIASELGAVYTALGEVSAAKAAYRRAATLAPDEPQFWLLLAQFSLGQEIELETLAIPAARNALALSSEDAGAMDTLGFAHFLTGDLVLAERLLLRAYDLEPARPQTLLHMGLLRLMQGEHDRARHSLSLAAALDPYGTFGQVAQRTLDALPDG
jgi:Flp pilus assembly protein TadD